MAKCKDCLHMELCARDERLPDFTPEQEALCQFFVDRHRYVVREKGEWVDRLVRDWRCSKCGEKIHKVRKVDGYCYDDKPNFCPNCGSDMRGMVNDGNL